MPPIAVATDLHTRFGDTVALDGVDLTIERGEIYGLIGPNGAGKTTLSRCLVGTVTPDDGTVSLFGDPPAEVSAERIGYLPQSFSPHDRLTPAELVTYYGGLSGRETAVEQTLETVGVDPDTATRFGNLSGGERRRVCVATALVNDPDLLVVDEPTTGIDPAGRRDLRAVFDRLADAGTTIVLTSHHMAEVEAVADRVGVLADGRLVAEGPPADLVATYGGPARLTIETDAPPATIDTGEWTVERTDEGLAVAGTAPTDIGAIVDRIVADGAAIEALSWTDPDLADVYLEVAEEAATDDRASIRQEESA